MSRPLRTVLSVAAALAFVVTLYWLAAAVMP